MDVTRRIDWSQQRRCLLLGAAGAGMRGLAQILHDAGHEIFGADLIYGDSEVEPTASEIAAIESPDRDSADEFVRRVSWKASELPVGLDACVASPAVPSVARLYRLVCEQNIPLVALPAAVGDVFADRDQVCVTGTHGKSTTTSLLAWMLNGNGLDAGVYLGAELCGSGAKGQPAGPAHYGRGRLALIEACEFGRSFWQLRPRHVILNGVDGDHFDCFVDESDEDLAYQRFLERVPAGGQVLLNGSCPRSVQLAAAAGVEVQQWMLAEASAADWCGQVLRSEDGRMTVRIHRGGSRLGDFEAPLIGRHNAENLLAAVAMAGLLGMSAKQCQQALVEFPGLRRRMEDRGVCQGMQLLDDYAHHPTAVTTTLEAVRQRYPARRVRVLFEPHQLLRLERCREQFLRALSLADEVFVLPVFPAREQVSEATCHRISQQLAATISHQGTPAGFAESVNAAVSILELTGRSEDVVLTMGAGTVHRIHDEVHRRFQRDSAA